MAVFSKECSAETRDEANKPRRMYEARLRQSPAMVVEMCGQTAVRDCRRVSCCETEIAKRAWTW